MNLNKAEFLKIAVAVTCGTWTVTLSHSFMKISKYEHYSMFGDRDINYTCPSFLTK